MSVRLPNPLCVLVWLAFLVPARLLGPRLDMPLALLSAAVAVVVLWVKPSPWETRAPAREAALLFAGSQFLCVLSYLYALAFKGAQGGPMNLIELPRPFLLGLFVVYLIRHHDATVRAATESAMTAAVYGASLFFDAPGERLYVASLALCYLLLFSRSRLRYLHSAVAVAVIVWSRAGLTWASSPDALRLIRESPLLGWGPARYEIAAAAGNQYMSWLVRYGAWGFCLTAAGLCLVSSRLLRDEDDLRRRAAVAMFLACGVLLLLTGAYLDGYRLFFTTAFLVAAVHESAWIPK